MLSEFNVMSRRESARAIITASAAGSLATAREVETELEHRISAKTKKPIVSRVNNFSVSKLNFKSPTVSGGLVSLWLGGDVRHSMQRHEVTDIVDDVTGLPYQWSKYGPALPIADLMDTSAVKSIRGFRIDHTIKVPMGALLVNRNKFES
jgi:hypothetical protein